MKANTTRNHSKVIVGISTGIIYNNSVRTTNRAKEQEMRIREIRAKKRWISQEILHDAVNAASA